MFDFSWSEIALTVIVALVFIGPKDLPVALRTLSKGVKAIRRMASEFQSHVDEMVRDADLGEVRDQFRDLKTFNIRDRFDRAIDPDRSIVRSFEPPPSLSVPPSSYAPVAEVPVLEESVSAPAILPPALGRRLARERAKWYAPAIIPPPTVTHGRRRVSLGQYPDVTEPDAHTSGVAETEEGMR
ncbi:Sec-independent protein translocase protein TatB [Brytella acorum]|uniref:Sec-independent protein translocase protein TatB n=1 Tax=Brytella acorum TaxID=2959299 RepID=A0AA35V9P9_9PROT|nr:Sec-independent protein translocase protein TatB [Brytella acorum]MDF3625468.1 Sec-independent protein translocase protein TatB [Brytella acorum]CAI9120319.1 Sec-independent protein translocase protein TatB [Brytella acorum]